MWCVLRAFTPISHNTNIHIYVKSVTINQHNLFDYYANCIEDLPFYFEQRTSVCSRVIILLCCSGRYKRYVYIVIQMFRLLVDATALIRFDSNNLVVLDVVIVVVVVVVCRIQSKAIFVLHRYVFRFQNDDWYNVGVNYFWDFCVVNRFRPKKKKTRRRKGMNKSCCDAIREHMNAIDLRREPFNRQRKQREKGKWNDRKRCFDFFFISISSSIVNIYMASSNKIDKI